MKIPVTIEDFVKMGKRFNTAAIVAEIDRLLPLATEDIELLSDLGYNQDMLGELKDGRGSLSSESGSRDHLRGAKQGAREGEMVAIREGRAVVRCGLAACRLAVAKRKPPKGETEDVTSETTKDLQGRIQTVRGIQSKDSASLRTRLATLKSILELPDLAPAKADQAGRTRLLAQIDSASGRLLGLSESKQGAKDSSKFDTHALNELRGRAYYNMLLLTRAGNAIYYKKGDSVRAAAYTLAVLNHQHGTMAEAKQPQPPAAQPAAPQTPADPALANQVPAPQVVQPPAP